MARMIQEAKGLVVQECTNRGLSSAEVEQTVDSAIIDRTIGDVDVRKIKEEGFADLAGELGVTIPGERQSGGEQYRRMRHRMQEIELELLRDHDIDLRMYDIHGIGNPLLRQQLSDKTLDDCGLVFPTEQIFLSLGGIDGIDRSMRMFRKYFQTQGLDCTFGFPAPGFAVVKSQAETTGVRVCVVETRENADYKLTPQQLDEVLTGEPSLRVLYLTVTNNPTAYSYAPDELTDLFDVIS
jgi:aspartate/methionine/tyrosine aminotransferase